MTPTPRRLIARIDLSLEIAEPRIVARSRWIAHWLHRVARAIERGDLPRGACVGTSAAPAADVTAPPT